MSRKLGASLPIREGHFLLESGYHSDIWFSLDTLFVEPAEVEQAVQSLAERLRRYEPDGVCGPLVGGAFLAQRIAMTLGVDFYYTEPVHGSEGGMFGARYLLPSGLKDRLSGRRVAVVDDAISAGSSVRATVQALRTADASIAVVAALIVLGTRAVEHFDQQSVGVESLERRPFEMWTPDDCPRCRDGERLEDPRIS